LERQKSLCAWIDTLQATTISHAPLSTLPGPLGDDGPSGMAKEVRGQIVPTFCLAGPRNFFKMDKKIGGRG